MCSPARIASLVAWSSRFAAPNRLWRSFSAGWPPVVLIQLLPISIAGGGACGEGQHGGLACHSDMQAWRPPKGRENVRCCTAPVSFIVRRASAEWFCEYKSREPGLKGGAAQIECPSKEDIGFVVAGRAEDAHNPVKIRTALLNSTSGPKEDARPSYAKTTGTTRFESHCPHPPPKPSVPEPNVLGRAIQVGRGCFRPVGAHQLATIAKLWPLAEADCKFEIVMKDQGVVTARRVTTPSHASVSRSNLFLQRTIPKKRAGHRGRGQRMRTLKTFDGRRSIKRDFRVFSKGTRASTTPMKQGPRLVVRGHRRRFLNSGRTVSRPRGALPDKSPPAMQEAEPSSMATYMVSDHHTKRRVRVWRGGGTFSGAYRFNSAGCRPHFDLLYAWGARGR